MLYGVTYLDRHAVASLGGLGETVDYAVQMHRIGDRALLFCRVGEQLFGQCIAEGASGMVTVTCVRSICV